MKRKFRMGILLLLASWQIMAQDECTLKTEFVETEKGMKLATDVYLPDETGKYPVILVRTPYFRGNFKKNAASFAGRGYAVVVQDCRGKFDSDGEFYAFQNERTDGLKTVAWIREQPWSNGKIAGYGSSYNTFTQWAIADELEVVLSEMGSASLYDLIYPQGLFSLATACNWGLMVDTKNVIPLPPDTIVARLGKSYRHLPLSVADDLTFKDNRFFNDWLRHEKNDRYWRAMNHRKTANANVLSIAGWYDIFLPAQLNDFLEIDRRTRNPGNRMIVGPWCHGPQAFRNEYGGGDKTGRRQALMERFLEKTLLGKDTDVPGAPFTDHKYNFFIMERNAYFGSDCWPPKEVGPKVCYLANDRIVPEQSRESGQRQFVYDPADPFPSIGGTFIGMDTGPGVQNKNTSRADQWVFESDVLREPLALLGAVSASLYVSSTAAHTDFMILVQDVFPNDTIINIQEGGKHVRLHPGRVSRVDLESWPTGYQLNSGHKLRIVITSAWFPRYNRNLNTGEPVASARVCRTATQTFYFGPAHPSQITLPVLTIP
ncbi:MAG: CocE/NonD family hydrolase [Mangrovibacterium sp.]|nr:CocE/NonD family hydrolase [Mangrovibacterium sp.]